MSHFQVAYRSVAIDDERDYHTSLNLLTLSHWRITKIVGQPLHERRHASRKFGQLLYDAEVQRIVSHIHRHRSRRIIVGFFCLVVLLTVSFFVTHNTLLTDIGNVLKVLLYLVHHLYLLLLLLAWT